MNKLVLGIAALVLMSFDAVADGDCIGLTTGSGHDHFFETDAGAFSACESAAEGAGCSFYGPEDGYYCNFAGINSNRTMWYRFTGIACEFPNIIDPDTGICVIPSCPAGESYNYVTNQCELDEIVCLSDEIEIIDFMGDVSGCISSPDTCLDVLGTFNGETICGDQENDCTAFGGTYGFTGSGSNLNPVCLDATYGGATCPSGSVRFLVDGDPGSDFFECRPAEDLPPTICDAQLYDCDGDGNIDDQNHNGIVDNGLFDELNGVPALGTLPEVNVGVDELNPAVQGAGDCDPTSRNYADCAGFVSDTAVTEQADNRGAQGGVSTGGTADGIATSVYSRISNAPVVLMFGNVANVFNISNPVCPAPSFSIFGTTFTIDYHCTLYGQISGLLSALMLILFSIIGIRNIASA